MFNNKMIRKSAKGAFRRRWAGYLGLGALQAAVMGSVAVVLVIGLAVACTALLGIRGLFDQPGHQFQMQTTDILVILAAYILFLVLLVLVGCALRSGLFKAVINMVRGEKAPVDVLFCRLRKMLGCFGLQCLMALKTFLWTLPGYVLLLLGMAVLFVPLSAEMTEILSSEKIMASFMNDPSLTALARENQPMAALVLLMAALMQSIDAAMEGGVLQGALPVSLALMAAGYILTLVLAFAAALRYIMSNWFYADDPSCGVRGAVRLSKKAMKGRKWQMIRLMLLYIVRAAGMAMLGTVALCLVMGLLMTLANIPQQTVQILTAVAMYVFVLVLTFIASGRMVFAQAAFYDHSRQRIL